MTPFQTLLIGALLLQVQEPAGPTADAGAPQPAPAPSTGPDAGTAPPAAEAEPVGPTIPGQPKLDPSLPAGTLIVELRDAEGKPLPKASIFVESSNDGGRGRRLRTETDETGVVRVQDLPTAETESIVVGHEAAGGVLTASAPFGLPPHGGARLLLVVPERTGDVEVVAIEHLHVVLEREGSLLRVTETFSLATAQGAIFANTEGLSLPLPRGAAGLRFADAEKMASKARLTDEGVVFTATIPPSGDELTIVFDLPIESGSAELEQEIPLETRAAQVISTWTQGGARLTVAGFPDTETAELRSGLTAQVAATQGLPGGRLRLKLEGITDGPEALRRTMTLVACIAILALGLGLWIRRRVRRPDSVGNDD